MYVSGIGTVFTGGRGVNAWHEALLRGWVPPVSIEAPFAPSGRFPVYHADTEKILDPRLAGKIRRSDRFTKLAVMAAADAMQDSGLDAAANATVGIVVATAFGPHVTTFRFLDEILQYGDAGVSPTVFSHSVHNAAASYIAAVLNLRGPCLTLTQAGFSFHEALRLAHAWLAEERCTAVLCGAVDECGTVMEYICQQQLTIALDGRIKPFAFADRPETIPGEGGLFFVLTSAPGGKAYARIAIADPSRDSTTVPVDLQIVDTDGMARDESAYRQSLAPEILTAGYAPVCGGLPGGSAFSAAAAALMIRKQTRYAVPVTDNPHGLPLCLRTEAAPLRRIRCIKRDCAATEAMIDLFPVSG